MNDGSKVLNKKNKKATSTTFLLFSAKLKSAEIAYAEIDYPEVQADLSLMTRAFKKNYNNLMGAKLKRSDAKYTAKLGRFNLNVVGESVYLIDTDYALPLRYNFFVVLEIQRRGKAASGNLASTLVSALSPSSPKDAKNKMTGELNEALALEVFKGDALEKILNKDIDVLSVESWTPKTTKVDNVLSALLYAFYTVGGSSLVQMENDQLDIAVTHNGITENPFFSDTLLNNKIYVTNFKRAILSKSQSPVPETREVCENIIGHYRMRDRIQWLENIYTDLSNIHDIVLNKQRALSARMTSRILFALTGFTVLSGLFFGLFQLNPNSIIAKQGPQALNNPLFLPPLVIAFTTLVLTLLLVRLWPNSKHR